MQENRKQARTFQEEIARDRKYWKQNQIWALVLAAVVLLNLLGGSGLSVATGPDRITLTMHDGSLRPIPYDSITGVQLLESPQYGTMIQGKETRQGSSGTWEHPQWGSYTLCVYASSGCALRLLTEADSYVISLGSAGETRQLYQIILEKSAASR